MPNGRLFGLIWRGCDMKRYMIFQLLFGYLEATYDEFYEYLEMMHEIEGSEAELIIVELKKIREENQ